MNTNKWGPSGWNQLGPSAYKYDHVYTQISKKHKVLLSLLYKTHLSNTESQLPCKYCRESYKTYITELPMDKPLIKGNLNNWLYLLHNKVNDKLRKQGYNTAKDPTFSEAIKHISLISKDYYLSTGWDYIHSIAHNYAEEPTNQAKILAKVHFSTLPYLLPHPSLTVAMLEFPYNIDEALDNRSSLVLWVYLLHNYMLPVYSYIQPGFKEVPKTYEETCSYYETFRAGCGKSKGKSGPSCRLPISDTSRMTNLNKLLKKL